MVDVFIAPTADVSDQATLGKGSHIWHLAQVREGAHIGRQCVVGRGAYIDHGVEVGNNCKIQNYALVYAPCRLEDGVFVGPAAVLTNDPIPRAVNPDGQVKGNEDWSPSGVVVRRGASIGAMAVVLPGVEIGEWAFVGAGSVVTKNVSAHALVVGAPARQIAWVGRSGNTLKQADEFWIDPLTDERFVQTDKGLEGTR
jgi:UDP-2-acetamido-3-amino-2,3-dideoxy-glucuronate N-acetyltransferase